MNTVTINGKTFTGGSSICISGNKILIDGNEVNHEDCKVFNIEINGNIEDLKVSACETLVVQGHVGSISTQSGNVRCGNVNGSISTMSGDVKCGNIKGSVSTMSGDVYRS